MFDQGILKRYFEYIRGGLSELNKNTDLEYKKEAPASRNVFSVAH